MKIGLAKVLSVIRKSSDFPKSKARNLYHVNDTFAGKEQMLKEIVVIPGDRDYMIGEKNRFVKSMANGLRPNFRYGIAFNYESISKGLVKNAIVYLEDVKYETVFEFCVFQLLEQPIESGYQTAQLGSLLAKSSQTVLPGQNGEVKINFTERCRLGDNPIIAMIVVTKYLDNLGNTIAPLDNDLTRIKFQRASKTYYYCDMRNINSTTVTQPLLNVSAWMRYGYKQEHSKDIPKRFLIAPAIQLVCTQREN